MKPSTRLNLAISDDLPEIVNLIQNNEVTWTVVPTGSGKSIGIPLSIFETTKMSIFCSQPTVAAVIGLFEFQKTLVPKGRGVGWAAEGTKKYGKSDRLIYATAGHIRRLIISCFKDGKARDIDFCDVLMVDEIHTGSKDNSMILDLWSEAKRQGVKVPKILLSTATDKGLETLMSRMGGGVFRSTFRHFAVETRYTKKNYPSVDDPAVFTDSAFEALDLLVETKGHGIVFCSGSGECEEMIELINAKIADRRIRDHFPKHEIQVLPCFSQCKREDIMLAISEAPKRVIKIVCATNVAESSLTIPDVKWVVDMMSEKRTSIQNGKFHLGVSYISKNSADQRKGRTGRTLKGSICSRMISQNEYEKLIAFRPLEIRTSPITDVVIELLDIGLDPVDIVSDLDYTKLQNAKNILIETGSIKHHNSGLIVTGCGRFVASMPMDVRNASALYHCISQSENSNLFWVVAAFVLVDSHGPSLLWFPRKERREETRNYQSRMIEYCNDHFSEFEGENPVETLCNALFACLEEHSEYNIYTNPWRFGKWSRENSVNNKKLKEICASMKRVIRILKYDYEYSCDYDEEYTLDEMQKMLKDVYSCLAKTYKTKELDLRHTMRGPSFYDKSGNSYIVDVVKTASEPARTSVYSLSEVQILNQQKGTRTNICSLWIPA